MIFYHRWETMNYDDARSDDSLKGDSFPLESWVFEIDDVAYSESGNFQVVHHLTNLDLADSFNGLGIYYYLIVYYQVGNEFSNDGIFVGNIEPRLLLIGN